MKKSEDKATPWPNIFIDIAAHIAGSPTIEETGSNRAPIKATAGEGQISQDTISMHNPMPQKAPDGFFITFRMGRIMNSSTPAECIAFDIDVTNAITSITLNNSIFEATSEVLRICIEEIILCVNANPINNIPKIQGTTISFFISKAMRIKIVIMIKI